MSLGEYRKESKRESAIGLSRLEGPGTGDCGRVPLSLGVVGDSMTIG